MEPPGGPIWPPPIRQRFDHQQEASRPASAASAVSSAASFRIPGISPPARGHSHQPKTIVQAATPSFVRLFTPQPDQQAPLFRSTGRDTASPVDWLAKYGPSPKELLDSSQAAPQQYALPLPSDRPSNNRLLRTVASSSADAAPPRTPQTDEQLRPFTASSYHRSKLVTADGLVGSYVSAILENRGIGREVGIASIDKETGLCVITQFADTPTYVRAIHHFSMYPPSVLLVPASGSAIWKANASASASRTTKRPKIFEEDQSESIPDETTQTAQKSGASILIRCLEDLHGIQAQPFHRKHWNYQEGARYLDRLLVDDIEDVKDNEEPAISQGGAFRSQPSLRPSSARPQTGRSSLDMNAKASTRAAILVAVANKFYLLSAVAGLFEYFTDKFNRVFTAKSLRIRFVGPEGTILINSNTAHDLELVRNLLDPRSKDSLYGLLDHCVSPMGRRLLKMNILQPLTDLGAISSRQEAVAECIRNEERFYAIRESLQPINKDSIDLDKLIHNLTYKERHATSDRSETERRINSILSLRTLLTSLAPARAALQNSSSGLLQSIQSFLDSEELDAISDSIQKTIDEDIKFAKGGVASRNAKMYAVRAERSPLLEVARETYRENWNDILDLCEQKKRKPAVALGRRLERRQRRRADTNNRGRSFLQGETGLQLNLKLISSGYLTKCELSQMAGLTEHFTNVSRAKSGKMVTMMTMPLKKLNARLVDSMNEVLTMSNLIIEELIQEIIAQVASLYKVSEALSLLDMIVSFAHVSITNDYVRPAFGDALDIRSARHPILDRVDIPTTGPPSAITRRRRPFVPNDIYLEPGERVCLVTGPNMSGKSTFLRQIALITVLAGIGCFVPASRATLPIPDALLSLLTHEDDATQNLSTFASEMRTSAFILSVGTPRSLVILDEMGRGTSPEEGCAVATAIIEELINEKGSTVFFATHFGELVDNLDGKEGVVCQHLAVSTKQRNEDVALVFHHKLQLGPGLNTHYSLQVAKQMRCFTTSFLQRAQQVAEIEQALYASMAAVIDDDARARRKWLRKIVRDLRRLVRAPVVDDFADDETNAGEGDEPLIEKLSEVQISATEDLAISYQ